LAVEMNQTLIEGLVDIRASMLFMGASVIWELGIMCLIVGHETYNIASGIVTNTWKNYKTFNESGRDCMLDGFLSGWHRHLWLAPWIIFFHETRNNHECGENCHTNM